jgi:6-phosphogluconolactonase
VSGSVRLHVLEGDAWIAALIEQIAGAAAAAIAARGQFRIVLAGGSTPRPVYKRAAAIDTRWDLWQVYFTDERCVPPDDRERNDRMAHEAWFSRVEKPAPQIHAIPAQSGATSGAGAYCRTLGGVGRFDLTLLGLGEDGHTASLFPGDASGLAPDAADAVAVHDAPKPPHERVTLSARRLADSDRVLFLARGAGKRAAVRALLDGADIPATQVVPEHGADLFVDAAAAGE